MLYLYTATCNTIVLYSFISTSLWEYTDCSYLNYNFFSNYFAYSIMKFSCLLAISMCCISTLNTVPIDIWQCNSKSSYWYQVRYYVK